MKEEGGQQVGKRTFTFKKKPPSILSSLLPFQRIGPWPILSWSRDVSLCIYMFVPFHVICLRGIRQALACNKTGPSIGHASILLHAWSP